MTFLLKNWLSILALIIAVTGGIPGIVSVVSNYRKNRSIFTFSLKNIINGEINANGEKATFIFLTGTISNKGRFPLTPDHFDFKIKINDKWIPFQRKLITESIEFHSDSQEIDIKECWKRDFQGHSGSISTAQPVDGHLLFISTEIDIDVLRDKKYLAMELICLDVFEKQHSYKFKFKNIPSKLGYGWKHPKHGVSIKSKN